MPLTLVHLQATGPHGEKALDSALRQRRSALWLRTEFEKWRSRKTRGAKQMLVLLDERIGKRLPASWFQRLAQRALAELGFDLVDEWPVIDSNGRLISRGSTSPTSS